jgi:alpha-beta hydrolase superfamily lysophospholipase
MIAMPAMVSTFPAAEPPRARLGRRAVLLAGVAAGLAGCTSRMAPVGPRMLRPEAADGAFVLSDGARLPYRQWLPPGRVQLAVLALHGFNDSRDAWALPAPVFAAAGMAIYAPDQRGFGAAPGRGLWPGGDVLARDAAEMAGVVRRYHPTVPLVLMGESMGAAALMRLAVLPEAPPDARYVLSSPAVWSRAQMNVFYRLGLWFGGTLLPGMTAARPPGPIRIIASDNRAALKALSDNPLTIKATRFDTIRGLVNLMDAAQAAAAGMHVPALLLYGGHDNLVPPDAMRATWRRLPPSARCAFYPAGYHLLLRDLERAVPIGDIIAWLQNGAAPLPSGADTTAVAWLDKTT